MQSKFMKRAVLGAAAAAAVLAGGVAQAVGVPGQGDWETTLQPRDLDGNAVNGPEAFYDTTLNITWLRNANVNGPMNWTNANTWANTLAVASIAGPIGGWRLPTMVDTAAPGWGLTNTGNFRNVQSNAYWSSLGYAPPPSDAWFFVTYDGGQGSTDESSGLYALAVRPGDVAAAVPEPRTYGLMLVGLSALVLAMRRRPR